MVTCASSQSAASILHPSESEVAALFAIRCTIIFDEPWTITICRQQMWSLCANCQQLRTKYCNCRINPTSVMRCVQTTAQTWTTHLVQSLLSKKVFMSHLWERPGHPWTPSPLTCACSKNIARRFRGGGGRDLQWCCGAYVCSCCSSSKVLRSSKCKKSWIQWLGAACWWSDDGCGWHFINQRCPSTTFWVAPVCPLLHTTTTTDNPPGGCYPFLKSRVSRSDLTSTLFPARWIAREYISLECMLHHDISREWVLTTFYS